MKLSGYIKSQLSTVSECSEQSQQIGDCINNEGKFYDRSTEEFIVPSIGKEVYLHVCNGSLWTAGVWIAVNLPNNKFAVFKITNAGNKRLKLLNGLDNTGDKPINGNPLPGTVIPNNSIFYPIVPRGADSEFATNVINVLANEGVDSVIKILSESEEICFSAIPNLSDADGDGHLFAGTKPDCDCESGASVRSCFRKLLKIITGQSGKTLCFPEVQTTTSQDVENKPYKRIAVFDENSCLKKGIRLVDLDACTSLTNLPNDSTFGGLIVCKDGVKKILSPRKGYTFATRPVNDLSPDGDQVWKQVKSGLQFFPLDSPVTIKTSTGSSTPTISNFPHQNCYCAIKLEFLDDGTSKTYELIIEGETVIFDRFYSYSGKMHKVISPVKLLTSTPTIIFNHEGASDINIKIIGFFAYP